MTLNDHVLEGVMAVILRYFSEFGSFGANYVKMVKDRPRASATKIQAKELSLGQCVTYGNIVIDY